MGAVWGTPEENKDSVKNEKNSLEFENESINYYIEKMKKVEVNSEIECVKLLKSVIDVWNLYGATEMPYVLANHNNFKEKELGSFTLKGDNIDLRISDEDELLVKSPALTSGYFVSHDASLIKPFVNSCWYPTGDRASIDKEGNVTIYGRKDRQVKIQGHRIELDEIECTLEKMKEVKEAAVIFIPYSQKIIGFIVLEEENQ